MYGEKKREEGDRVDQEEKRENQQERNLASNQFPMCSPQSGTPREIHRVTQRRVEGGGKQRLLGGEEG